MTDWVPLLSPSDEMTALASEAVDAIVQAVVCKDFTIGEEAAHHYRTYEEALLYGYLALTRNDVDWAYRTAECLNSAVDRADQETGYLGLFGGLAGLGWTVEHISQLLHKASGSTDVVIQSALHDMDDEEQEDLTADVDAVILRELRRVIPSRCYDLISGLVGFGAYFMERWPRQTAADGLYEVFVQLEGMAEVTDMGVTWRSSPELLPESYQSRCTRGYYNLGVAHGIPGIIYFLGQVSATNIVDQERCHRLLDGAMGWLISQQRPRTARSRFSSWILPGEEPSDSRLGWCYGDLGILAVLLQVARHADRRDWQEFAHDLLDHCLAWPADRTGVVDAPLCHGAAGVAHIFNRIYQSEGDSRCLTAALAWYKRALAMRQPGTGVAGFTSFTAPDPSGPIVWEANPGFVDGAIGIALALLAAMTPVEPRWDRSMLLSTIALT